jgi:hypothetical protein
MPDSRRIEQHRFCPTLPATDVSSIEHANLHKASSGDSTGTGLLIVIDGQIVGGIGASFDTPERDVQLKWDSGSGTYFGVDPKLDMIYILMEQTQTERGRIRVALKKMVYDAFAPSDVVHDLVNSEHEPAARNN